MKLLAPLLLATLAIAASTTQADSLINLEEAAEVMDLRISKQSATSGHVLARICDQCELLRLEIDSSSRIQRARQPLDFEQAVALRGKGATVLFDPVTKKVTRILYWN